MYSLVSLLFGIYPLPAMYSLLVTIIFRYINTHLICSPHEATCTTNEPPQSTTKLLMPTLLVQDPTSPSSSMQILASLDGWDEERGTSCCIVQEMACFPLLIQVWRIEAIIVLGMHFSYLPQNTELKN